ncbi:MAG: FAD-dependent oxidoreductase [Bacilli bacterium]|nr:FAD-dependent oxidoreductase [Bacilli bacterium]
MAQIYDSIIIGAGPCGMRIALELKKKNASFLLLDPGTPGGKVNVAPRVDNYPGFTKIPGPDLAFALFERLNQAEIEITPEEVLELKKENDHFAIKTDRDTYYSKTAVIASGTKDRKLGLENEDKLFGHGLTYCALCDGHFFKDQDVIVIGGGNAALKEAIHMLHVSKKVYLIHRRNEFRGSNKLVDELKEAPNAEILTPYIPYRLIGEEKVEGIEIENRETGERRIIKLQGIIPAVGQIPNTQFVQIEGVLNEYKTVPVNRSMETSCPGLFAGGDVLPRDIRQIYLAEHDGIVISKSILTLLGKE